MAKFPVMGREVGPSTVMNTARPTDTSVDLSSASKAMMELQRIRDAQEDVRAERFMTDQIGEQARIEAGVQRTADDLDGYPERATEMLRQEFRSALAEKNFSVRAQRRLTSEYENRIGGPALVRAVGFEQKERLARMQNDLAQIQNEQVNIVRDDPTMFETMWNNIRPTLETLPIQESQRDNAFKMQANKVVGAHVDAMMATIRSAGDVDDVKKVVQGDERYRKYLTPAQYDATLKSLDKQRKTFVTKWTNGLKTGFNDYVTRLSYGGEQSDQYSEQNVRAAFGKDADRRINQIKLAVEQGQVRGQVEGMTVAEQNAFMGDYESKIADSQFAGDTERQYRTLMGMMKQDQSRLKSDPVRYVQANNEAVMTARQQMTTAIDQWQQSAGAGAEAAPIFEQERDDAVAEYIRTVKAAQIDKGVSPLDIRILDDDSREIIADQFKSAEDTPEQANMVLSIMENQWGAHWPEVYRELGSSMPDTIMTAANVPVNQPGTRARILALGGKKDRDIIGDTPEAKATIEEVDTQMMEQFQTAAPAFAHSGSVEQMGKMRTAAKRLALDYVSGGMEPGIASERAFGEVMAGRQFTGNSYYVPPGLSVDDMSRGADSLLIYPDKLDFDLPEGVSRRTMHHAIQDRGMVVNSPDETGYQIVYRPNDSSAQLVTLTRDGEPLVMTYNEVIDFGTQRLIESRSSIDIAP
jgi:hypothetical protein